MILDLQYFGGRGGASGLGAGGGRASKYSDIRKAARDAHDKLPRNKNVYLKKLVDDYKNFLERKKAKDLSTAEILDLEKYKYTLYSTKGVKVTISGKDTYKTIQEKMKDFGSVDYIRRQKGESTVDSLKGSGYGGTTDSKWSKEETKAYDREIEKIYTESK